MTTENLLTQIIWESLCAQFSDKYTDKLVSRKNVREYLGLRFGLQKHHSTLIIKSLCHDGYPISNLKRGVLFICPSEQQKVIPEAEVNETAKS